MSRAYLNLGLPPEVSNLSVLRTAIRRLHPDTLAARSWSEARKRYYLELLQAHAAALAAAKIHRRIEAGRPHPLATLPGPATAPGFPSLKGANHG